MSILVSDPGLFQLAIESETVGRSVTISNKGGKLLFHASIGALVKSIRILFYRMAGPTQVAHSRSTETIFAR